MLGRFLYHLLHGVAAATGTFVNVPATGLYAAIVAATPGTVITETGGPGAPIALSFTNLNIPDPGIAVVFDPAQVVTLKTYGVTGGMAFYSGVFQGDVTDETGNNYAVQFVTAGANRIALRGSRFAQSWLHVTGVNVTDLDLDSIDFRDTRSDVIQILGVQRLRINNVYGSPVINTVKFCYYDDGTLPVSGHSEDDCNNAGGTPNGHWIDTSHSDFAQIRSSSSFVDSDITLTGNTVVFDDSGFNDYGSVASGGQMTQRLFAADNSITTGNGGKPFYFRGTDFDLRRNLTARLPNEDYFKINYYLVPDAAASAAGGNRVQGYGNTADVFSVPGEVGSVDLASPTLNGSPGVVAAELPRIAFPAWFPRVPPRPAPLPTTDPPRPVNNYGLKKTGTPTAGTWFTIYLGKWRDSDGATYEYRFELNGVVVPGCAQVCQAPAGNAGAVLTGEARGTTAVGTSAWYATPPVTLQ